jgi:hypothetical protein
VDATAKAISQRGFVIIVMHQYAYHGKGRTIHSAGQLEHYKNMVDDRSMKCGGRQCITTNGGFILPLDIINGLPHLRMAPNTNKEFDELPHIVLTSSAEWDPTVIDHTLSTEDDWYNTIKRLDDGLLKTPFDKFGNYRGREPTTETKVLPPIPEEQVEEPAKVEEPDETAITRKVTTNQKKCPSEKPTKPFSTSICPLLVLITKLLTTDSMILLTSHLKKINPRLKLLPLL